MPAAFVVQAVDDLAQDGFVAGGFGAVPADDEGGLDRPVGGMGGGGELAVEQPRPGAQPQAPTGAAGGLPHLAGGGRGVVVVDAVVTVVAQDVLADGDVVQVDALGRLVEGAGQDGGFG